MLTLKKLEQLMDRNGSDLEGLIRAVEEETARRIARQVARVARTCADPDTTDALDRIVASIK